MHSPGLPSPSVAPSAAGRPWPAALLVAGGLLALLAGWLAAQLSGLLPGGSATPARPAAAVRQVPAAPPRALPAPGAVPPGTLAARYLASWVAGDYDAMYNLLAPAAQQRISRAAFRERYMAIAEEAMIVRLVAVLAADADPRSPSQPFTLTVETARTGVIHERNTLPFVLTGGQWGIDWQPSLIFADLRPGDRIHLLPDTPTRGRILDRNGQMLAHQVEVATIGIVPAELADADRAIERLSAALGLEAAAIRRQMAASRPDWFVPLARRPWRSPPPALRALADLPGVEVRVGLERVYPLGSVAAHVVGYVGPVRPEADGQLRERGYRAGEWIGVAGVEASAEALLAGERGGRLSIVTPDGAVRRVLAERPARPGHDVYLTLDLALQRAAEAALGDQSGAIVGFDPASGALRALVSRPAFDPNVFVDEPPAAQALVDGAAGRPLLNRATAAAYPPGELFATVTLAAALEGLRLPADAPIDCPATFRLPGRPEVWRDRQPDGRGRLTLQQAFVQSCSTAFYGLAQRLDARDQRALPEMARRFGLGMTTGLTALPEVAGVLPAPGNGGQWTAADALNLAAGHGGVEVTPLQLARAYAAIANGGQLWTPRLIERVVGPAGPTAPAAAAPSGSRLAVAPATLAILRVALTERSIAPRDVPDPAADRYYSGEAPAGLSGTAATGIGGSPHAWSVAFTPTTDAHLALVVLVERGGDGERTAALLLQQTLERGLRPGLSAKSVPVNRPVSSERLAGGRLSSGRVSA